MNNIFQQGCTVDGAASSGSNGLQKFIEKWSMISLGNTYSRPEDVPLGHRQLMLNAMERGMGQAFHKVRECSELQDAWNEAKWATAGKKFRMKTDAITKEYGISRDELFDRLEQKRTEEDEMEKAWKENNPKRICFEKAKQNIIDKTTNQNVLKFLKNMTYEDIVPCTDKFLEKFVKYMDIDDFTESIIFNLTDRIFMDIDSKEFPDLQFILEQTTAEIIKFRRETGLDEHDNTGYTEFLIHNKYDLDDDFDEKVVDFAKKLVELNMKSMGLMGIPVFLEQSINYDVDRMIEDIVDFEEWSSPTHKELSRL